MQSNLPHHIRRFRKAGLVVRRSGPTYLVASPCGGVSFRPVRRPVLCRLAWAMRAMQLGVPFSADATAP